MFEKETKDLIGKAVISAISEFPRALYRAAVIVGLESSGQRLSPEAIAERAVAIADAVHKKTKEAAGAATGGRKAEQ